jgi:hypothetical protein
MGDYAGAAPSTGAHARLLAWAILQYVVDDILPAENIFLTRLRELASVDVDPSASDHETLAKIKAGSMLATLYGWRLFEPYRVRGLGLKTSPRPAQLDGARAPPQSDRGLIRSTTTNTRLWL